MRLRDGDGQARSDKEHPMHIGAKDTLRFRAATDGELLCDGDRSRAEGMPRWGGHLTPHISLLTSQLPLGAALTAAISPLLGQARPRYEQNAHISEEMQIFVFRIKF